MYRNLRRSAVLCWGTSIGVWLMWDPTKIPSVGTDLVSSGIWVLCRGTCGYLSRYIQIKDENFFPNSSEKLGVILYSNTQNQWCFANWVNVFASSVASILFRVQVQVSEYVGINKDTRRPDCLYCKWIHEPEPSCCHGWFFTGTLGTKFLVVDRARPSISHRLSNLVK